MDYGSSTYNGYTISGSSGGYNIVNYDLVVFYSL